MYYYSRVEIYFAESLETISENLSEIKPFYMTAVPRLIEKIFDKSMSSKYNIHRTRQNFKNNGLDDFKNMSIKGVQIIDNVVKKTGGKIDLKDGKWYVSK